MRAAAAAAALWTLLAISANGIQLLSGMLTDHSASATGRLFNSIHAPWEWGVQQILLNGPLTLSSGSIVGAECLVFLKALLQEDGTHRLRAVATFFDPKRVTYHQGKWAHHNPPIDWVKDAKMPPRFFLRTAPNSLLGAEEIAFEVMWQSKQVADHMGTHPYMMELTLKGSQANWTEFYFCIGEWTHAALVTPPFFKLQQPVDRSDPEVPWSIYSVLTPFFGIDVRYAAFLLATYTAYHAQALGFTGTMLYERGNYLQGLAADPRVVAVSDTGHLCIMLWNSNMGAPPMAVRVAEGNIDPTPYQKYDQHIIYNHAALSLYGTKSYMYIADCDEYLAIPRAGIDLPTLLQTAPCNEGQRPDYIGLERVVYGCTGISETEIMEGTSLANAVELLHSCGNSVGEKQIGKTLVDADKLIGFWTHGGYVQDQTLKVEGKSDGACTLFAAHLNDLTNRARSVSSGATTDASWLWAVDETVNRLRNENASHRSHRHYHHAAGHVQALQRELPETFQQGQ